MATLSKDGEGYRLQLTAEVDGRRVTVDLWAETREEALELQDGAFALLERAIRGDEL